MMRDHLNRRAFLKGAGGIAVALPYLESLGPASAQTAARPANRFLAVYTPGGTVLDRWRPEGDETSYTLRRILAPLEPLRDQLLVTQGLSMRSARGEQHQAGIIAWLTGTRQNQPNRRFAAGPSLDQVIASRIATDAQPHQSLEFAVRWATGKSQGNLHPINVCNFADTPTFDPIPPRLDPQQIFRQVFIDAGEPDTSIEARLASRRSILDFVGGRYRNLAEKLSRRDRVVLDQHLTRIRDLERSLEAIATFDGSCGSLEPVNTDGYEPLAGAGDVRGSTDEMIPVVGRFMMDMMVTAMACNLTGVGTLQWTDTEAKHTFPWLELNQHHHYYQHDGGYQPDELELIYTWYSEQHAYLLRSMQEIDMGGHSLLDESIVFFGSELQRPNNHNKDDMPFLLAGGGGGLQCGRFIDYGGRSHNDLLAGILNLYPGEPVGRFGEDEDNDRPIDNLRA